MKRKESLICLYASNAMIYAFNALFYCFLPIYFNAKFSSIEAGVLLSIGPAVAMVAPLFWGMLADKAKSKNTVLIWNVLCSAVFFFLLKLDVGFLPMCIIVGVTMLFMSPFPGIIDAITMEHAENKKISYGPIRIMGTLGFGLISLISSFFTSADINVIFYIYVGMALLCALALWLSPQIAGHAGEKKKDAAEKTHLDIRPLFRSRHFMLLVCFMTIVGFVWSYYSNYFPTYLTETLAAPQWVWGLSVLITVIGEIPFFFLYNRLFDRFGIKRILFTSLLVLIARHLLLGFFVNPVFLLISNMFTGVFVTVITYCCATYITRYIAPELQATGQNLMYGIGQGVPRMLGGVVGGMIDSAFGTRNGLYLCAGIMILTTALYFLTLARDKSPQLYGKTERT